MTQRRRSARSEPDNVSTSLGAIGAYKTSSKGSIFEYVREKVDFLSYAHDHRDLKPVGANFRGRCPHPDHPDRNPSCTFYTNRFNCFACGCHGDIVTLHGLLNNIESPYRAAESLCIEKELEVPAISEETRQIALERRQRTDELITEARRAHDALEDHLRVAEYWKSRGFDADIQNCFLLGADGDGAATIPLWNRGEVHGVVRRNLAGEPKYLLPKKEDLLDGYRPLFIPDRICERLLLVEGYVDVLALSVLGFAAIGVGGTSMGSEQRNELDKIIIRHDATAFILPDADEAGMKAARRWAEDLYPNARLCTPDYATNNK